MNGLSVYDVVAFGAKGDGKSKDTASIQAAIDAAEAAGGGEVYLGPGIYLTGSIYLKDNVDFHLAAGAVLLGSPNPLDYSDPFMYPLNFGVWTGESSYGSHLIVCYEKKNVTVRGPGKIDGNSKAFLLSPEGKVYNQSTTPWRPSQMLWFAQCEDIRVTDLEIANSTQWSCLFHGCERVFVRGCRVHNRKFSRGDFHTNNGDGFDIDCCRGVSISDCDIDVADDAITLRASPRGDMKLRDCSRVNVTNCRLASPCNAIRLGVGNGKISDAVFSNLVIYESRTAINIVSAYSPNSRGCDFERIRFENIVVECGRFLWLNRFYAKETTYRDIVFSGISGSAPLPCIVCGTEAKPCGRILFRDVDLDSGLAVKNAPETEIAGGTLKFIEIPDKDFGKAEWGFPDLQKMYPIGDTSYDPNAGRKWKLIWNDEFDGDKLDESKWVCERGVIRNEGTPHAYSDAEKNVRVENGVLILEAHKERVPNPRYNPDSTFWMDREYSDYSSGSIETQGKFDFTYGKVEVRAKVPYGRGMWPAIWMLGSNYNQKGWPMCGELDVMEFVGSDPGGVYGTMHWADPENGRHELPEIGRLDSWGMRLENRKPYDGFHTYTVFWDKDSIVFYYDNERYFTYDVNLATLKGKGENGEDYNPFRLPMYLKLNLALGGSWAGDVDDSHVPGRFEVDYVRVYAEER